jgi:HK97 family phage portal protein
MNIADYHNEYVAGVHPVAQRSLENPNLPLNDPAVWEEVFGSSYRADTGESITAQKALTYAPFYRAVQLISSDVAKLPRPIYKRRADIAEDARERDRGHRLNYVLNVAANEYTEAIKFWERLMSDALIYRHAFARIMFDGTGSPAELYNLLPDRTTSRWIDGKLWYFTEISDAPHPIALFPWEVLHIEGPVLTAGAQALFQMAKNSIALGLAQEKFAAKFFKHGGRVGGVLELPAAMGKVARDTVEEGFRKAYEGADNPFKTVILRDNAKFHEAQQSPRESQMVEATESQTRQIAHWFNLPPSKLGLSDSVSYNSKAEDNQNYLDTTLQIWLTRIESACNFRLISERQSDTHFIEHNVSKLLRMNRLQLSQVHASDIAARIRNPNECRGELNMMPYEGGDQFVNPNTMKSGDDTQEEEQEEDEEPDETPLPERSTDYRRMIFEIAARARDKAKRPQGFIDWIDGNLAPHRADYKGKDIFPFDEITTDLRRNLLTWKNDELTTRVDEWAKLLEERA